MENKIISDYINLLDQITAQIKKKVGEKKVAVLVSGGIDSSIIAYFVQKHFSKTYLFSLGTKKNSDFYFVDILNNFLKKPLKKVEVEEKEVKTKKPLIFDILRKNQIKVDETQVSLALSFFLVLDEVKKNKIKYVFTGQGPDILLAGYHKYEKIPVEKLNEEIKKDLPLLEVDKKRDQSIASYFNLKLINPYLDPHFVEFSLKIQPKFKKNLLKNEFYEKYISRKVGERLKLPKEIILRHKKALQYSTGIRKII